MGEKNDRDAPRNAFCLRKTASAAFFRLLAPFHRRDFMTWSETLCPRVALRIVSKMKCCETCLRKKRSRFEPFLFRHDTERIPF